MPPPNPSHPFDNLSLHFMEFTYYHTKLLDYIIFGYGINKGTLLVNAITIHILFNSF